MPASLVLLSLKKNCTTMLNLFGLRHEYQTIPFLSINPSGRVPFLLLPNGFGLEDTPAIIDYLDTLEKPYLFLHGMDRKKLEISTLRVLTLNLC